MSNNSRTREGGRANPDEKYPTKRNIMMEKKKKKENSEITEPPNHERHEINQQEKKEPVRPVIRHHQR